jgi:hypothetical protein
MMSKLSPGAPAREAEECCAFNTLDVKRLMEALLARRYMTPTSKKVAADELKERP